MYFLRPLCVYVLTIGQVQQDHRMCGWGESLSLLSVTVYQVQDDIVLHLPESRERVSASRVRDCLWRPVLIRL